MSYVVTSRTHGLSRRELLRNAAATLLASTPAASLALAATRPAARPRFSADPFSLGVASGYPTPDGVALWTRLAPDPLLGGGMSPEPVDVTFEVALDEKLTKVVRKGVFRATAEWAHAVHVEVDGLEPDRWYHYRFRTGGAESPIGRTRTTPPREARPARCRFAVASCQHFEQGWFAAYRHMRADDPDLVVFVGDYIYESSWGGPFVRKIDAPEPVTLDDYRTRYATYRTDRDLQAAHAACPWLLTWDDHEVDNDYADDVSQDLEPKEWLLLRRAAAYKAYYEHMPLRRRSVPLGPHAHLYDRQHFGDLMTMHVLDDRQYRSPQVCPKPARAGSNDVDPEACPELDDPKRGLLGSVQEAWLFDGLGRSKARWNVVAQQTLLAPMDKKTGPGRKVWTDGWDGYTASRDRLLSAFVERKVSNPVVVGGDVHSFWVTDLKSDFGKPDSKTIGTEFVGTSITAYSGFDDDAFTKAALAENPHLRYGDATHYGYLLVTLGRDEARADLRAVKDKRDPKTSVETIASFVVKDGKPGAERA